jgi:translation initiation factor 2B subunit (eIF-2B alpha/beta/delta family)
MVVIANRIHRAMYEAKRDVSSAAREAAKAIELAANADGAAASNAAELVSESRVLTLSRSETITEALLQARPPWVGVAESRPGSEGRVVADTLAQAGIAVTVFPDAAMGAAIVDRDVEVALVGADAVLPSGAVINKVGTRLLALAARAGDVPMYAVCAEDKIAGDEAIELERADTSGVPLFEVTPPQLFAGIVTEHGVMTPDAVGAVTERVRSYSDWMEEA